MQKVSVLKSGHRIKNRKRVLTTGTAHLVKLIQLCCSLGEKSATVTEN